MITPEGEEFLGYARQMLEHYQLIEERYVGGAQSKKKFSVSMQHYTFAVEAFIRMAKEFGMDEYEFAVYETTTAEVIDNVKTQKSEVGVLYINDFNEKVMQKLFKEAELEFISLFDCPIYVYMSKNHPLASIRKDDKTGADVITEHGAEGGADIEYDSKISMEQLRDYPCLSFDQGSNNSFYFAEEVLSTYDYKQIIKASDRATFLNLMIGLNGYTLCSGIICQELNGDDYTAIPLNTKERMTIGYIKKKNMPLSRLGEKYISILQEYENHVL
jgi:DNA-binding transcriptional LysR family regulator